MMTDDEIKSWPTKVWMAGARKPAMHKWLQPKASEDDKKRLKMVGNIVCPPMAYLASHILASMWWEAAMGLISYKLLCD